MADVLNPNPEAQSQFVPLGFEDVTLGADFTFVGRPRAIFVGGAGIVKASVDGIAFHSFTCVAGSYLLGAFKQVKSTGNGTSATLLVGCL